MVAAMLRAAFAATLLLATSPALARDDDRSAVVRAHPELQQRDQMLLDVGWRLATGNAPTG